MKTDFNERELAMLDLCLEFSLSNIDVLEEIVNENIESELNTLKQKLNT